MLAGLDIRADAAQPTSESESRPPQPPGVLEAAKLAVRAAQRHDAGNKVAHADLYSQAQNEIWELFQPVAPAKPKGGRSPKVRRSLQT